MYQKHLMGAIKQCIFLARPIASSCSNSANLFTLNVNNKGIAVVSFNRPPVNSLNYETIKEFYNTLIQIEIERCKGMILTSTSPKVFSAGLDIFELYGRTSESVKAFWRMYQDVWIKLYSTPYPTVAAINGHSPAGGCLLALSCEYRIIVPNVKIGLNETQLGLITAFWFQDCLRNVIGTRQAEKALIAGTMFSSEEALEIGLVDELAADKEDLMRRAETFLEAQMKLPALARSSTKNSYRKDTLQRLLNHKESDVEYLSGFVLQPEVQEALGKYLQSLKKK